MEMGPCQLNHGAPLLPMFGRYGCQAKTTPVTPVPEGWSWFHRHYGVRVQKAHAGGGGGAYRSTIICVLQSVTRRVYWLCTKLQLRNQEVHQRRLDKGDAGGEERDLHGDGEGRRGCDLLDGRRLLSWSHDERRWRTRSSCWRKTFVEGARSRDWWSRGFLVGNWNFELATDVTMPR